VTAQVRQGRCPEAFRKPCPETIPGPGRQTARVAPSTVSRTGRTSLLAGCPGCRHSRHGDLSACRRGTKPSTSSNIAGRGTGPNKFDRMPACWDRSAEKIGWYARVICASTSIEEESGVREAQLVRRGFRVCPGDPEVAVGVAGVGRRHPHTGDAFDVGDRCVTDPVRTDAEFGGPRQVSDASSESLEPLVVEMATVPSMQDDRAPMVAPRCVAEEAVDEVSGNRDPPLLGVLLYKANCSGRRCQVFLAESDRSLASAPRLSEESEDEIVEFRIPRVGEKGELDLFELVGAECSATGWWAVREGNLGGRVVTNEASVDCTCESGPGGQDHGFLGADTVAGLRVGSGLGTGAERPARDIGGADGRGVILASPADQAVERFGVAMVAGE